MFSFCCFLHGLHGGHGILLGNFWVLWLGLSTRRMHQPETHWIPMDQKITPKILSMGETSHIPPGQKGKSSTQKCRLVGICDRSKESRGFSIPPSNNHAPMKSRGMNSPEDERNRVRPHLVVWIGGKHLSVQQEIQREIGNIKHGKP